MLSNLADWCMVETIDTTGSFDQVAVAHRDPSKEQLLREVRRLYPPTADRPDVSLRVLTTGKAELIPSVSDALLTNIAQDPAHLGMLRRLAPRSLIVVPLRTRERVLGTILLANAESGRRFGPEDLELAEDLGRRAALAIEDATLHKSEQDARRRAERAAERIGRLPAVTAALSRAVTPTAVAEVVVGQGAAAGGADGGYVRLLTADGGRLELVAAAGACEELARSYASLPSASPLPDAAVFRGGSERYFESPDAVRAAFPQLTGALRATVHEAIAMLPLHGLLGPIGVMGLTFADRHVFEDDDRELLKALANQCAQALERARLYEGERQARAAAEHAIERTASLQRLAAELAEALTPDEVAQVVVTQGIASVGADAGALQLLNDDGTTLEVVNGQGTDRALVGAAWRRLPIELKLPSTDALTRREPVFIESNQDIRDHYPHVEGYPPVVDGRSPLRARAGAHIPLIAPGRPLGVLFLGFARPRRFSDSQRSFVLALGRQCAQALNRAQLYEAELEGRSGLSRLVERLQEGVLSIDAAGRVEFASSKAREMLGTAALEQGSQLPETWLGFPLHRFATGLFAANAHVVEAEVATQDGQRVFAVTGIPAARSDSALVVVQDVSEREQRLRAEREFVDNAAHELRTPLAAITSAIERLQAGAREVPERRDRFLGHIQRESARLNRLASSLLVLARAQTREQQPRREAIALRGLLEELTDGLELHPGVALEVDCPADLVVCSNGDLLEHALLNLVSNAARHTRRGRIRVSACLEVAGPVTIAVSDTGPGIPPDQLGRLFDRFYRGPGEDGQAGFGLGLPITKEAVEAMGGRVEVESAPGAGTTVGILLPDAAVPAQA